MCHGRDVSVLVGFMHVYTADFEVSTSGWQWQGSHTPHPGECCWSGGRYTSWLESQGIQEICIIVGFIKIFVDLGIIFESEKSQREKFFRSPISSHEKKRSSSPWTTWFCKSWGFQVRSQQPANISRARTHNDDKDTIDEASSPQGTGRKSRNLRYLPRCKFPIPLFQTNHQVIWLSKCLR